MGRRCALLTLTVVVACALAFSAVAPAPPAAFLRTPDLHDDRVVFACEGDLWLGELTTGKATRLTRDDGPETEPRFSPDGKLIAYTASYDGTPEVYVMPVTGGAPRRLTYRNTSAEVVDWTPDGASIVFRSPDYPRAWTLWSVPVGGGFPRKLPLEFASHLAYAADGQRFVFTRFFRHNHPWFRYEGGQKNDVWVGEAGKLEFRRVFATKGSNEFPVWAGERLYFVNDEAGKFSVITTTSDGKQASRAAGPYDAELRSLQTDGKRLIYERGHELEVLDLATGKPAPARFELTSDLIHTLPYSVPAERFVSAATLGPSGRRVLIEARGQIVSVPAKEGDAHVLLAKEGVRYRHAAWSPDATKLAFIADEPIDREGKTTVREQQLYLATADGTNARVLTSEGGRQLVGLRWSPDSKWLTFSDSDTKLWLVDAATGAKTYLGRGEWWTSPPHSFSPDSKWLVYLEHDFVADFDTMMLYEIASGRRVTVSDGRADDLAPTFSTDGKWLAFLSKRHLAPRRDPFLNSHANENPIKAFLLALHPDTRSPLLPDNDDEPTATEAKADAPRELVIDGLYDRLIELPVPPGNYTKLEVVGNQVLLLGLRSLTFFDLKTKQSGVAAEGVSTFQVSADGKRVLLFSGATSRVIEMAATASSATGPLVGASEGRLNFGGLQLRIHPRAEWEQIYWESWRLIRDYFYLANLHGADWPAIGERNARLLPAVRSRDELNELLRWLLAELSTSHGRVSGGDTLAKEPPPPPGFLGIEVEPGEGGFYRLKAIFRGDGFVEANRSPLAAPGLNVRVGDYLIEVAGVPAKVGSDWQQGLVGRVGQVVAVKVNQQPTFEGARTLRVRPIAEERRMRYLDWVQRNRDYVMKASGGRVGYLHLAAMMEPDLADFIKQYFPQRTRDALLVDVRFNNGGYVSARINTVLKQRVDAFWNQRANPLPWTRQFDYFPGPLACLMNEFSYSDGEEFPHEFRTLGLGPIIGRRTRGGEVGSDPGWPLVDGGVLHVPNYGAWTVKDGWIIEGPGLTPDHDIESDPNAFARGKDPQLDKAVELMLAALKQRPPLRPPNPPPPVRARKP